MAKGKKKCDCIFCNSKCPECGSPNVVVTFTSRLGYENKFEGRLIIELRHGGLLKLRVKCNACGKGFNKGNKKIKILEDAIKRDILYFSVTHKKSGKIKIEYVPQVISAKKPE